MKKLLWLLLLSIPATAQNFVTVTASSIYSGNGNHLLPSGTISFQAVNSANQPISFQAGGGGPVLRSPTVCSISNGVIQIGCLLANSALTNPLNVCFSVTVKNSNGQVVLGGESVAGYTCAQTAANNSWCSSGTCDFDHFVPNIAGIPIVALPFPSLATLGGIFSGLCPIVGGSQQVVDGYLSTGQPNCVSGGAGGGGNVSTGSTPATSGQFAQWTGPNNIQGVGSTGSGPLVVTNISPTIVTPVFSGLANGSISGNSGTTTAFATLPNPCPSNQFSTGNDVFGNALCTTPPGGGNVSNVNTPSNGQVGIWTGATTLQGLNILPAANLPALTGDVTSTIGSAVTSVVKINGSTVPPLNTTGLMYDTIGFLSIQSLLPVGAIPAFSGDVTNSAGSATLTVTGTGGVAFAPSATINALNASNISSGTLNPARLGAIQLPVTHGNGPVYDGSTASPSLVVESQPIDVGPNSSIAGTGLDGKINTACLATYSGPGTVPVLDARGYPTGSSVLMLTNPYDNCNKSVDLLLGAAIYIQCVPWVTPHLPGLIQGVGISQAANPTTGTVIRAGTVSDGCPTNFPGTNGAVINWTASGFLGATFGHGPWNWYTTLGGFNNSGTTVVAQIYPGAMTTGTNSLDWTQNSFGFQLSHVTLNGNGLANFGIFTASEEEHTELDDVIFNSQGLGNGIVVTQVTGGSSAVAGTFPYPKLLVGNLIYLNNVPAVVGSATTSSLTLVGTYSGTTSSTVTFAWAGATAQAVFDRMSNNGCAGTQALVSGVVTCTPSGSLTTPTQSGPGNTYIHSIQSAQNSAYVGVQTGTAYGLVYIGYGLEIYIWDASGAGSGARAYATVATGGAVGTPTVSYGGSGYAAAGGGGTQCAFYSPMSNRVAGLTCTPIVTAGVVTAIALGGTNLQWAVGANAVTGPVIVSGGWGEAGNNLNTHPSFADDYYIAGVTSMTLLGKQCQGLYGTCSSGPLGSSCVHIGDGSGLTYGGLVSGVQAANEYAASGSPCTVHIAADLDQQLFLNNINQQTNSSGRPIILDDRFNPPVSILSTPTCEGVARYTYGEYEQCGVITHQVPITVVAGTEIAPSVIGPSGGGLWFSGLIPCIGPGILDDSLCEPSTGPRVGNGSSYSWSATALPTGSQIAGISFSTPTISFDSSTRGNGSANIVASTITASAAVVTPSGEQSIAVDTTSAHPITNFAVVWNGASPQAVRNALTTSTSDVIGICQSGCNTTGPAIIARSGTAIASFDGAATANDYVQISANAGQLHDAGATCPTSGQTIGTISTTIGSAGTTGMDVNFGICPSAGGGSSIGANYSVQYGNGSGGFVAIPPPSSPAGVAQNYVITPGSAPTTSVSGVPGRAITGTTSTDTIASTDCTNREEYNGSVSVAVSLPTATTLAVPKCVTKLVNNTTGSNTTLTVTPATWTINGSATLTVYQGQIANIYVDPGNSTNWVADKTEQGISAGTNITLTRSSTGLNIASSGGASYPGAGVPVSTGSAWGTSLTEFGAEAGIATSSDPGVVTGILMVADGSHGIKPLTNIGVDSSGRIATYKGNGTSGSGVPAEYFGALGTGLTANYNSGSPATLVTPAIANSAYRICYFEAVTQVGTVSGTAPSGTIGYTDSGGIARTQQLFATNSTNTTATVAGQGCTVIATNSSTPVTFTGAGYATSGAASLNYELMIVLEQLQ